MRHYKTTALCLLMLAIPAMTQAQKNVKEAFDKFLKSPKVEYTSKHSLEKDPETNKKEGQMDIYEYAISTKNKSLIKDLQAAFESDKNNAYIIESGTKNNKGSWEVSLAVGNGSNTSVGLGKNKGENYMYACFIDPQDNSRTYRYAYGMSWLEHGDYITGRLVVTYATTLKYRQGRTSQTQVTVINNGKPIKINTENDSTSWIGNFHFFAKQFEKMQEGGDNGGSSIFANEIYKMCKGTPNLTQAETLLVLGELQRLQKLTKDEFLRQLFEMSKEHIK